MKTLGLDCSLWQDDNSTPQMMDFLKSKSAGARFVFIKASQGVRLDPDYVKNWLNAENILPRGAYHFLDWSVSVERQIEFFSQVINGDAGELPPVLDYEMKTGAPTKSLAFQACLKFLKGVEQRTGVTPLLYTSPGYWYSYGSYTNQEISRFKLWLANYGVAAPSVPKPWTTWLFWQFGVFPRGKEFGAESQSIDLNWFNGSENDLAILTGTAEPAPQTLEEKVEKLRRDVDILMNTAHSH